MNTDDPTAGPTRGFWKRVLDRNPFYPLSAILLLLGIHQLSTDPFFLPAEAPKLFFNFGALQFYELLAVFTAILLSRRRITYEATLLVIIDSILTLVPFILISQAVLIGQSLAAALCCSAALLVLLRMGSLHYFGFHTPRSLFAVGGLLLVANTLLPFIYRPIMEEDVADWTGPARLGWYFVLPLLHAIGLFLKPDPQYPHRWLPAALFHLWVGATAVHLRCVDYISNLPLELALLAPLLWVMAWTLVLKASHWMSEARARVVSRFWPGLPTLALLPAIGNSDSYLLPILAGANALFLIVRDAPRRNPWTLHLAWISILLAFFGLPQSAPWWPDLNIGPGHLQPWVAAAAVALAGFGLMTPHFPVALLGILGVELVAFSLPEPLHQGIQLGLAYPLLHGLLWSHYPSRALRILQRWLMVLLILHAGAWVHLSNAAASRFVFCEGLLWAGICAAMYFRTRCSLPWRLALIGPLLMATPLSSLLHKALRASPKGLLILGLSFLIFALGTLLALGKHYSRRPPDEPPAPGPEPDNMPKGA